jgi:uncharacterized protein (DUF3820 family)
MKSPFHKYPGRMKDEKIPENYMDWKLKVSDLELPFTLNAYL